MHLCGACVPSQSVYTKLYTEPYTEPDLPVDELLPTTLTFKLGNAVLFVGWRTLPCRKGSAPSM